MNTSIEQQPDVFEQLTRAVDEKLEVSEPEEWGDEIELAEGEKLYGRYLETATSPVTERAVVRALARTDKGWDGPPVFIRMRTVLESELGRVRPQAGDYIVIARGEDKEGQKGPYHMYAVAVAPCADPLPETAAVEDDLPF